MRKFVVDEIEQAELEEAAAWYQTQRDGLGDEFVAEVKQVLMHIAHSPSFPLAPIVTVEGGVVRREFVDRFPYVVIFVENDELRRVIMIRRGSSDAARWRGRLP